MKEVVEGKDDDSKKENGYVQDEDEEEKYRDGEVQPWPQ